MARQVLKGLTRWRCEADRGSTVARSDESQDDSVCLSFSVAGAEAGGTVNNPGENEDEDDDSSNAGNLGGLHSR